MNWRKAEVYAVVHKDEDIRAMSRSGGVFTALSDKVLETGGVIYGCVLNKDFQAVHIRATEKETRNLMCGSKYIQSKMGETYKDIEADLVTDKLVLFSGTSCQVAGLKGFLGKEYDNLLCVDIVCFGVPSPLVWKKYLEWQESKAGAKVIFANFRNKKEFGWRSHVETLMLDNGRQINSKVFAKIFSSRVALRPCCYKCPYKSTIHPGDITIADYWGIEKVLPDFDDNKGVSLVLVNNARGDKVFESIKPHIMWQPTQIENAMQPALIEPFNEPHERMCFWRDFHSANFYKIAKKYGGFGIRNEVAKKLRTIKRYAKIILNNVGVY